MVIDLVGVLEDGAPRASFVPDNPRKALRIVQGTDVTIRLTVTSASGVPVELGGGDSVKLTVKKRTVDGDTVAISTGVAVPGDGPGRFDFVITANQTKGAVPGRYVYDVWLTKGGARDPVVPLSPFILEPTATPVP